MNILIDTNILIPLEDTGRMLDPSLAKMRKLSEQNGHVLYIHPVQREDIHRDRDENRRRIVLSRLDQYQSIPAPPSLSEKDIQDYGWSQNNERDRVDNLLLHALCRGAIHLFVTDDKKIHTKAKAVQIQEKVHRADQFLRFLESQSENEESIPPLGIQDNHLHEFDVQQEFFNSLRDDYPQFNEWYLCKANELRKAWNVNDKEILHAICIYKEEFSPTITDDEYSLDGVALKLCTFKVGEKMRGRKLGERLLFSAFKYASSLSTPISYVYLHIHGQEHEKLVSLCEDYGFEYVGKYEGRDDTYVKKMLKPTLKTDNISPLDYAIKYYPHYLNSEDINKFIVPIRPEYHDDLFPDISLYFAAGLFRNDPNQYNSQSNTIKKAYICHSNITQIKPGDLLFFYRTHDRKSVECVGIVEQAEHEFDVDKVLSLVSKRTVYSKEKIEKWLQRETLVILFRFIRNFPAVNRNVLMAAGIEGSIQSIRKISHEQYLHCFIQNHIG